jgi:hypothetical protein
MAEIFFWALILCENVSAFHVDIRCHDSPLRMQSIEECKIALNMQKDRFTHSKCERRTVGWFRK